MRASQSPAFERPERESLGKIHKAPNKTFHPFAHRKRNPELFSQLGVLLVSLSDSSEESMTVPFFEKHPEWKRRERLLEDMKGNPWTLFGAKKIASIILSSMFSAGADTPSAQLFDIPPKSGGQDDVNIQYRLRNIEFRIVGLRNPSLCQTQNLGQKVHAGAWN